MGQMTIIDVCDAVKAMSDRTRFALIRYAANRVRRCGLAYNADDLFHDALLAAMAGERIWNSEKVDFYGFICGIMRSMSTHRSNRLSHKIEMYCEDAPHIHDDTPLQDERLDHQETLTRIRHYFSDDSQVLSLIESFDQHGHHGYGTEFKTQHGLDQRQLETVVRRLRRGAQRVLERA